MSSEASKQAAGRKLNEEGRESPLEGFQLRYEWHMKVARDEIAKGDLADPEVIQNNLKLAQEAGEAIAPYRHARSATADLDEGSERASKVVRLPQRHFTSLEEWSAAYEPVINSQEAKPADA